MDVNEKRAKIWRKDYEGKNGPFYRYTVGVSRKNDDGSYANTYIPIRFARRSGAPEKIENGAICSFSGFMSVESYTDKDGKEHNNPQIVALEAKFEEQDADAFEQAEIDIPF